MCAYNFGEIFLNFIIEPKLTPYVVIDFFQLYPEEAVRKGKSVKAQW